MLICFCAGDLVVHGQISRSLSRADCELVALIKSLDSGPRADASCLLIIDSIGSPVPDTLVMSENQTPNLQEAISETQTSNLQDPEDIQQGKSVTVCCRADPVTPRVTNAYICRRQTDINGPPECFGPSGTGRSHLCSCQAIPQIA